MRNIVLSLLNWLYARVQLWWLIRMLEVYSMLGLLGGAANTNAQSFCLSGYFILRPINLPSTYVSVPIMQVS
jgi:hypothetical protein